MKFNTNSYKTVLASMTEAVFICDQELNLLYLNPVLEQMCETPLNKAIGRKCYEVIGDNEQTCRDTCPIEEALSTGHPVRRSKTKISFRSGEVYNMSLSISPLREGKKITSAVVIMQNITELLLSEQKRIEAEIAQEREVERGKEQAVNLQKGEQLFHQVYEYMVISTAQISLDFRINRANQAFCRLLGYSEEELIGKSFIHIAHPEVLEENLSKQTQLTSGEINYFRMEKKFIHKQGHTLYGLLDANLVRDEADKPLYILGTVVDINEQKQTEARLRESEQKHRLIFDEANDAIFLMSDDMFIDCNTMTLKMFGCSKKDQIVGKPPYLFSPPVQADGGDSKSKALKRIGAAASGEPQTFEWLHKKLNGELFEAEVSLNRLELNGKQYLQAIVRDITERKRAEAKIRESEIRFRQVAENLQEWIWETDIQGMYTYSSPVVETILGYNSEDIVGKKHFYDLFIPEEKEEFKTAALKVFAKGEQFHNFENRNLHKNGEVVWLSTSGVPMFDQDNNIIGYRGVDTDITTHKQEENKRQQLEEQLRQAHKMEAVGQLAGGIAHDFNNLLQIINGYTEIVLGSIRRKTPEREKLESVARAGKRAATLVNQLLAFSRRQLTKLEDLNIDEVYADLIKQLSSSISDQIQLEYNPGHHPGVVHADRNMMEQVLMNLCINAQDAMPEGGTLTVATKTVMISDDFCRSHAWARPGHYSLLSVTDTGCGIDKDTLESVFEPFFTTKDVGKGSGLGLSMVYGIVMQHNGLITADSELDKGSTFKVYLPVSEDRE